MLPQVFGASRPQPGSAPYVEAEAAGAAIASAGFELWNGGYMGTMEASAKGAKAAGGVSKGFLVPDLFPHRSSGGNEFLSDHVDSSSLLDRIGGMTEGVGYFLVLPGTVGTLTELCVAWNVATLGELGKYTPPRVFCYRKPWQGVLEPMVAGLGISDDHLKLITFVDDAAEAVALIKADWEAKAAAAAGVA